MSVEAPARGRKARLILRLRLTSLSLVLSSSSSSPMGTGSNKHGGVGAEQTWNRPGFCLTVDTRPRHRALTRRKIQTICLFFYHEVRNLRLDYITFQERLWEVQNSRGKKKTFYSTETHRKTPYLWAFLLRDARTVPTWTNWKWQDHIKTLNPTQTLHLWWAANKKWNRTLWDFPSTLDLCHLSTSWQGVIKPGTLQKRSHKCIFKATSVLNLHKGSFMWS